ncbi:ABC transporter transmembrane region domain-containing protein [Toxoplasma gondii GT1]|uniref:ABC transporter transmembrane region domain-containing protein n=3 Tax=Toxoplasma gondii TaxID=5811 RepID=S7VUZ0_TOXGG|nr:ABC transporter transmembrane region domain-containing protein [Toxoplasma gondii GT1]KAF4639734.1 ABC transporter transmembrane region domain-containing protein [Toxoplasma gondii]RQX67166.1 ABC transporter transmembrane region domain-containing protein [Toxoplasma gondii CAST]
MGPVPGLALSASPVDGVPGSTVGSKGAGDSPRYEGNAVSHEDGTCEDGVRIRDSLSSTHGQSSCFRLTEIRVRGYQQQHLPALCLPHSPSRCSISWTSWPPSSEDSVDSGGDCGTGVGWFCEWEDDTWESHTTGQRAMLFPGDPSFQTPAGYTYPQLPDPDTLPTPTLWHQIRLAKKLWYFTGPDRHLMATAALCMVLAAAAHVCIPHFVGTVVDTESQMEVKHAIICLVLAAAIHVLLNGLRAGLLHLALVKSKLRLQQRLFSRLLMADMNFFQQHAPGGLSARLCVDCSKVCDIFLMNLNVFLRSLMQIAGILVFMAGMSKELVLVVCFSLPVFFWGVHQVGMRTQRLSTLAQTCLADSNKVVHDVLSNILSTKVHTGELRELQRFGERSKRYFCIEKQKALLNSCNQLLITAVPQFCTVVLLIVGERLVKQNRVPVGTLVTCMLYQQQLASAFSSVGNVYSTFMEAFGAAQYVISLIGIKPESGYYLPRLMPYSRALKEQMEPMLADTQPDTEVSPMETKVNDQKPMGEWRACYVHTDVDYFEVQGEILFCNVVFRYPGRPAIPVLNGVNIHVLSKEFVGVAGASGSGKTTLLRLIDGLVHADQGAVFLDGRDVRYLDPMWLRRQVGVLWQDPDIMSGTVQDNLYYGVGNPAPLPCYSNEVCMRAKKLRFTETFPAGYDTEVGEKGNKLSCGQRVRLALARILNRQPRILLVDDPLKQMGAAGGDTTLQDVLQALRGQVTILVTVRSLETAKACDRIYVLERGVVVQEGHHESLMQEESGAYRSLILTEKMLHM